ncbi:MAG: acyl-ACP--UDP-N-acetylglucosamine O-acyltransferase [Verrucomicrobiota bacterium]
MIHETAVVSGDAVIGEGVEVGPFAVIEENVEIGAGSKIEAHAVLKSGAMIGQAVTIGSFCVIAGLPQDLGFNPTMKTYVRIGDRTTVREGSTINRATEQEGATTVGEDCFLMAVTHLGHDCQVGNQVVMANNCLLAGHVTVGDSAFLGGGAGIHQYCRIGKGAMIAGHATITMDIPHFTMMAERNVLFGLNLVGMRRRGVSRDTIKSLKSCYTEVFARSGNIKQIAKDMLEEGFAAAPESTEFLEFFSNGVYNRGFARPNRED